MKYPLAILFVLGVATSGTASVQNIFGSNDRAAVSEPTAYPYSAIGRLTSPNGNYCTASLVGPNTVITASHCISDGEGTLIKGDYRFELSNGQAAAVTKFWPGQLKNNPYDSSNDWAVLELDHRLGDQSGYFKTLIVNQLTDERARKLTIAGYGIEFFSGNVMSAQRNCTLRSIQEGQRQGLHDCDASPGDSGAPIFYCASRTDCALVGIHTSARQDGKSYALRLDSYVERNANVCALSLAFESTIQAANKQ